MKIYFAGSIRGGRDDKDVYVMFIEHLSKYGKVLTEHVGAQTLTDLGEDDLSEDYIYKRDIAWIRDSDIVIAEVSNPSLGVGYEIGFAENLNKEIICFYKNQIDKKLSAMSDGNPNILVVKYSSFDEVVRYLDHFFKELK